MPREAETPEVHEREPQQRLETIIYFVRHGAAEAMAGADRDPTIDRQRHLSPEGRQQAEAAGRKIADELKSLESGDVIFSRSSPYPRAVETVGIVRDEVLKALPGRALVVPISRKPTRNEYRFPLTSFDAYSVGTERRGTTKGLPEEWVRDPSVFQRDLDEAGAMETAQGILNERTMNLQRIAARWERTGRLLGAKWQRDALEGGLEPAAIRAPRLVILIGSHGGLMPEPWLNEAVRQYEQENGDSVSPELSYGEYFKVHFPANVETAPTLTLHGKDIPLRVELFRRLKRERRADTGKTGRKN
ncbi:hypothetical protein A3H10_04890 [Candidatus Uhrbacteria bacterium RIFCSPLOWO2_12_FULL_46_10]|uniref:Phosphoglycerate mutase n=1 Tax=Candidatus Uhrbacteria bacterium RIFCSPLOWO2_01_FULL_47_25 TaxID=1802402 RepID=A0A1F7US76_9BACT|nr:MAG: hypothetical protein UX68_C0010G0014 [Parcubacteria group bacterium GW2011_GWA2_46_9]OGL59316.1 MAG: hypothetical protein A2752_01450 [Candidatus Uhrbacteria bacterium RIFCSPHIGHO2_01_FULL_46_23]OGL68439.1 MAG: hypothetical protein A3D60_02365 [Candidatus Uhrbacteria bacterium RIFCSPHIGHO2_02_FULL_47_29]OGL75633.1 MAG: hypothetical protein A3E96_01170 [Candidatus Uhrbacteria bacterium RIFCSPHIGHO2_12_FULL_46_13]OGL81150.1 MAG: hypothetical protein A2936_00940 [Candidatus Uhrbacteria bac